MANTADDLMVEVDLNKLARLTRERDELREALNGLLARFEDGCGTCHLSPEEWDHLKFGIPAIANAEKETGG